MTTRKYLTEAEAAGVRRYAGRHQRVAVHEVGAGQLRHAVLVELRDGGVATVRSGMTWGAAECLRAELERFLDSEASRAAAELRRERLAEPADPHHPLRKRGGGS